MIGVFEVKCGLRLTGLTQCIMGDLQGGLARILVLMGLFLVRLEGSDQYHKQSFMRSSGFLSGASASPAPAVLSSLWSDAGKACAERELEARRTIQPTAALWGCVHGLAHSKGTQGSPAPGLSPELSDALFLIPVTQE